jgi:hypothetical protein
MPNRYSRSNIVNNGKTVGTGYYSPVIYQQVKNGNINFTRQILQSGERLDNLAGAAYGDASLWWIIASASGIGWGLQVPPGTVITIPSDLNQVYLFVG